MNFSEGKDTELKGISWVQSFVGRTRKKPSGLNSAAIILREFTCILGTRIYIEKKKKEICVDSPGSEILLSGVDTKRRTEVPCPTPPCFSERKGAPF